MFYVSVSQGPQIVTAGAVMVTVAVMVAVLTLVIVRVADSQVMLHTDSVIVMTLGVAGVAVLTTGGGRVGGVVELV